MLASRVEITLFSFVDKKKIKSIADKSAMYLKAEIRIRYHFIDISQFDRFSILQTGEFIPAVP